MKHTTTFAKACYVNIGPGDDEPKPGPGDDEPKPGPDGDEPGSA